jgi:hypothetical protein
MHGCRSLLAAVPLLLCSFAGCDSCGAARTSAAPQVDAARVLASSAPPAAPPPPTAASSASPVAPFPSWPPQGEGCAAFANCCEAATPNGSARITCMAAYNESLDCKRAQEVFRTRLEALHAPVPLSCRSHP